MKRPDQSEPHGTESNKKAEIERNEVSPVEEIQGDNKKGSKKGK